MHTHTANAFFSSLLLHGIVVGLVVFLTYYAAQRDSTPPVIFELVAGPPTNRDALVAPALGVESSPLKLSTPVVEPAQPEPVVPEPVKQELAQPETPPVHEEVAPPAKPESRSKPEPKAKPTEVAKQIVRELKKSERLSYKDYLKKRPSRAGPGCNMPHRRPSG